MDKHESYVVRPIGDQMFIVECAQIVFGALSLRVHPKKEKPRGEP